MSITDVDKLNNSPVLYVITNVHDHDAKSPEEEGIYVLSDFTGTFFFLHESWLTTDQNRLKFRIKIQSSLRER